MAELYQVMVHDSKDVTWEDDSFASGWTWPETTTEVAKDGDVIKLTVKPLSSGGYIERSGLNVNAAAYPYLVVCLKGDGNFRIRIWDGGPSWKDPQDWAPAPTDYMVKIYDLSSLTTGTITAIELWVGQSEGKKAWYDFVAFMKQSPRFLEEIIQVKVHQQESGLDEFDLLLND